MEISREMLKDNYIFTFELNIAGGPGGRSRTRVGLGMIRKLGSGESGMRRRWMAGHQIWRP
jgi:hypothetical protein